ncbi:hypothetical protein CI109_103083 [Kwoniella shandongensis]|uniref:Uncharacterized protein n=1 Tax=Kwoniella shandongensis TaxID=1734106 RepID=A0A5M6C8U1_9TREE|nr:uncharacterized protein CI109_000274 [Kwoniella shandongensis]KAA5531433.1 hypothetical protein CI109_000274 [Kwoniella shandongensis]
MDEEASFANLLSSTIAPARPSWNSGGASNAEEHDPWANPFSDTTTIPTLGSGGGGGGESSHNPFASTSPGLAGAGTSSTYLPTFPTTTTSITSTGGFDPESPKEELTVSPYVQQLERERDAEIQQGRGMIPDPPSVIAAREQEGFGYASSAFGTPTLPTPSVTGGGFAQEEDPFAASTSNPFAPTTSDPANIPFTTPAAAPAPAVPSATVPIVPPSRKLPSSLIDEDLMAESDPEQSLKKAFKKSTPAPASTLSRSGTASPVKGGASGKKAYVFTPGGKGTKKEDVKKKVEQEKKEDAEKQDDEKPKEVSKTEEEKKDAIKEQQKDVVEKNEDTKDAAAEEQKRVDDGKREESDVTKDQTSDGAAAESTQKEQNKLNESEPKEDAEVKEVIEGKVAAEAEQSPADAVDAETSKPVANGIEVKPAETTPTRMADHADSHDASTPKATTPTGLRSPTSVPLPTSSNPTPTISRVPTPLPLPKRDEVESSSVLATPSIDRVSVSPLEAPVDPEPDYGFKSLSIGASSTSLPPPIPTKDSWSGNGNSTTSPPASSRFGGKGWGVLDDEQDGDGGLFGRGGPSIKSDPWGNDATSNGSGGWGEPGLASLPSSAGPSRYSESNAGDDDQNSLASPVRSNSTRSPTNGFATLSPSAESPTTPSRRNKLSSTPLFQITVSDPHRMGDAVRGYTVYTVRTKTTSPHYRKGDFTVLRRFSDFLWLYEVLTLNNPGVIVPPVPDKHAFGRFQDQFIETRRSALERCLAKITSHPVLQLDPDLRMFLESDSFALDSKSRKQEAAAMEKQQLAQQQQGLLAGWTGGPKFVEQDEWFDSRRNFLDSLESQLKSLSKSIDLASKHRLELSISISEYSETILALSESDLGTSLSAALAQLAQLAEQEKENQEESAKADVVQLLNMADEYVRFIASVRVAFGGRVKVWSQWQNQEKEVTRLRMIRERMRQQGRLGEKVQSSMIEIADAERKARELAAEFERLTKLVKSEFVRFERERVDEFKSTLEKYLDGLVSRERGLIDAWEGFHKTLAGTVEKSQGLGQGRGD